MDLTRKRILAVGIDKFFLRACSRLGVEAVVVYSTTEKESGQLDVPPGIRMVFAQETRKIESILMALAREGMGELDFDAVHSSREDGIVVASALAALFGARSIPPRIAVNFRDKSVQKRIVREAGLETAEFVMVPDIANIAASFEIPFARGVFKPSAAAGTANTVAVRSGADVIRAAKRFMPKTRVRTYLVEQYISGDEWFVDGVVSGGELIFASVGHYREPMLDLVVNNRPLIMSRFDPKVHDGVYARVLPTVQTALQALGLEAGVFHMELFYDRESDRLVFSECAARRGGSFVQEEIQLKFGVDLAECALRCILGDDPGISLSTLPGAVGSTYLPSVPGVLIGCPREEEIFGRPGVRGVSLDVPLGFEMPAELPNSMLKIGRALLHADSQGELERKTDDLVDWFVGQVVTVPTGVTQGELRRWHAERFG
ncbi:ATP-grasp domain-containing protein [Streptomyces sp. NBC_00441]|uniref:ATP-grasp domain-containing protein n=1 Tax=Streptomyces sp. NBC_00441 TaxID=2975742 RepID=UPI002E2D94C5|nr:ATP-grasp domain-containing protein [Streptomyces sp. NBC_00441]